MRNTITSLVAICLFAISFNLYAQEKSDANINDKKMKADNIITPQISLSKTIIQQENGEIVSEASTSIEPYSPNSTITITSSKNWSAISPLPTSSDAIVVKNDATLTVDVSNALCASLQLGSGSPSSGAGTLSFNNASQLTVSGEPNSWQQQLQEKARL